MIPRNFIPAVEKGVAETEEHGGALGFPVVDVKVTCFDGKHHPVDSSEMAFKTAASMGLRDALAKASPILLEPVSELVVTVPEANQGDIMGDLNGKRGRIQGSASVGGGEVEIVANVPTSEVLRYAIDLRSMTGGRGRFTTRALALRPGARPPRRQDRRGDEGSREMFFRATKGIAGPVTWTAVAAIRAEHRAERDRARGRTDAATWAKRRDDLASFAPWYRTEHPRLLATMTIVAR